MFYESIEHVTTLFYALENKVLKIESNAWEFDWGILKKCGETLEYVSCFSLHLFRALAASCVLYNRAQSRLLYLLNNVKYEKHLKSENATTDYCT